MSNAILCDVSRYLTKDYWKTTASPLDPAVEVVCSPESDVQHMEVLAAKVSLLHLHSTQPDSSGVASDQGTSSARQLHANDNTAVSVWHHEAAPMQDVGNDLIRGMAPANQQALVTAFFLDGSAAVDGQTFSRYPIYGHRGPQERLTAVHDALHAANVTTHLPDPRVTGGETREQYWCRLARHYIHMGMEHSEGGQRLALHPDAMDKVPHEVPEPEDSFYVVDLGRVIEQMARWRSCLPMVRPHFAVKCNPNLHIMRVLAAMGAGFDCASKAEIEMVLKHGLVSTPDDIVFANPCKKTGDLRFAHQCRVNYVTFDNPTELERIATHMPNACAILRIKTDDQAAVCSFSTKFGAPLHEVEMLLAKAQALGIDIYGVSFHVGSGNSDPQAYVEAVRDAHSVFEKAAAHGFNCTILDIGGGYPGTIPSAKELADGAVPFEAIAAALRPVLEDLFPDTTIISEPGRFFTAATHALCMNVFATRRLRMSEQEKESCRPFQDVVALDDAEEYQYYASDGLYHTFNCIVFDHAHPQLILLDDIRGADALMTALPAMAKDGAVGGTRTAIRVEHDSSPAPEVSPTTVVHEPPCMGDVGLCRPLRITTIFGPTCDSLDCILKKKPFPEMYPGDWLLSPDMGSYTTAAGCAFNGFSTRRFEWVCSISV